MRFVLYHYPLCPFSRKARIILKENEIDFDLILEKYWERRRDFLLLNPSGVPPLLIDNEARSSYSGNYALAEFIEEKKLGASGLLPLDSEQRYQVRSVAEWFDTKFFHEVTKYLLEEKIIKNVSIHCNKSPPNSAAIRAAKKNVTLHLEYLNHLLKKGEQYLCGERVTLADLSAAAQLSVLDYIGDVPWEYRVKVKSWYALIKSRPSFKPILEDEVLGIYRASHYKNPDF